MSLKSLYLIVIRLPFLQARNHVRTTGVDDVLKYLVLTGFALGVGWAEYAFFARFWELLGKVPLGNELALPHVFSLLGSFLFAFLCYSSVLTALSSLYRSDDLSLLFSSPAPMPWILLAKWFDVAVRSGATLILLSLPPALALGVTISPGWDFYPVYVFAVLFLAASAISLGIGIAMVMAAFFPVRRMHQTLLLMGLCIAVILITGLRMLHLETLWSGGAMSNPLILFVRQKPSGFLMYGPGRLLANALTPSITSEGASAPWTFGITIIGIVSIVIVVFFFKRIFLVGWWKSQEQADAQVHPGRWDMKSGHQMRTLGVLTRKDWIILKRDASVWTQLFMMLPLAMLYLMNLYYLPLNSKDLAPLLALANVVLIAMIVSAIGARFLFPATSREGRAVWIPASSPISPSTILIQKLFFVSLPVVTLSVFMLAISIWILHFKMETALWSLIFGTVLTLQLCGLAVCLGFWFPTYRYKHLLAVSLGKGALLFMVLALAQITSFAFISYHELIESGRLSIFRISPLLAFWFIFWNAATIGSYFQGKRQWSQTGRLIV